MSSLRLWAIAFVLTYLFETPVYALALRRLLSSWRTLGLSLVLNLASHPFVFLVLPSMIKDPVKHVLCAEGFAVIVEGLLLLALARLLRWPARSWVWFFGLSLLANAVSVLGGMLCTRVMEELGCF